MTGNAVLAVNLLTGGYVRPCLQSAFDDLGATNALASRMIGGTVICFGGTGARPGYLMKRGTIILGKGPVEVTPTFMDSGVHELVAMRLIARWLIDERIEGGSLLAYTMRRLVGDTAVLGKGEILVPDDR